MVVGVDVKRKSLKAIIFWTVFIAIQLMDINIVKAASTKSTASPSEVRLTRFDKCLITATTEEHVLDKESSILSCFKKNKTQLTIDKCFDSIKKIKSSIKSDELSENLKSVCFYEVATFQNAKSCLAKADLFKFADNHDEAVFECYQQFQTQMTQKQCLEISNHLTYPAKKEYLADHCRSVDP